MDADAVVAGRLVANDPLDNHPPPDDGPSREAQGSSRLSPDQQDWYQQRFKDRYVIVQDQPARPNRKARRLTKRRKQIAE